jgi:hypothetical protein
LGNKQHHSSSLEGWLGQYCNQRTNYLERLAWTVYSADVVSGGTSIPSRNLAGLSDTVA